jgi:hypothetical protein
MDNPECYLSNSEIASRSSGAAFLEAICAVVRRFNFRSKYLDLFAEGPVDLGDTGWSLQVSKHGFPNPFKGEEQLNITMPVVLKINVTTDSSRLDGGEYPLKSSNPAECIDQEQLTGPFGPHHTCAVQKIGWKRFDFSVVVWPNDVDRWIRVFPDNVATNGQLDSRRHDWFEAAWVLQQYNRISSNFAPQSNQEFRYGGGLYPINSFEGLLWLRWQAGHPLRESDLQFIRHTEAQLSQVCYRNKLEYAGVLSNILAEVDIPSPPALTLGKDRGIVKIPEEDLESLTDLMSEANVSFRRQKGMKLRPNQWVQESRMFMLLRRRFSRARRQYSPSWLQRLRLDVFVPELNVAFEYQGQQHYEPVSVFGGQEGYERTKARDRRKAKLCSANNLPIVYWRYDEAVTDDVLDSKLNELLGQGDKRQCLTTESTPTK